MTRPVQEFLFLLSFCLVAIGTPVVVKDSETAASPQETTISVTWAAKIPMRDGVTLNATIYRPYNLSQRLPVIFTRHPTAQTNITLAACISRKTAMCSRWSIAAGEEIPAETLSRLGDHLSFEVPAGGIALWAHADETLDVDKWASSAMRQGVVVVTGRTYALDGNSLPFLRLGFASLNSRELQDGVRRLAASIP